TNSVPPATSRARPMSGNRKSKPPVCARGTAVFAVGVGVPAPPPPPGVGVADWVAVGVGVGVGGGLSVGVGGGVGVAGGGGGGDGWTVHFVVSTLAVSVPERSVSSDSLALTILMLRLVLLVASNWKQSFTFVVSAARCSVSVSTGVEEFPTKSSTLTSRPVA